MRTVLTIAGSDPCGGAGVQSDIKTFEAFGLRGLSAVTALTAQNRRGVQASLNVPAQFLTRQIDVLLEEFRVDAVKIGMLGGYANLRAVAGIIKERRLPNVVLDPVLRSTGGFPLIDKRGAGRVTELFCHATVATPNIAEAEAISGMEVNSIEEMEEAARRISSLGAPFVLVKGGHLKGHPVDVLYDGKSIHRFKGTRLRGPAERFHGSGCMLSAAIACYLAMGLPPIKAVGEAKAYVESTLAKRK
ncbi:MAG: bifunctional hydroxymethylpyrimidine kinase/phosphomethylpyrimidine kinase [Deltaproteobacteria bacterium]|nr:bifunctional hydroxymethylpyrimidine kinase/phosphomethylpyrimidine kinase [Deltaproteobacteria bacterium]